MAGSTSPSRSSAFDPRVVLAFFLGFSSGLPYAAVESTLQAWLTSAKLDREVISMFGWVLLPYTLKFLWAPFLDRYRSPLLGRRRGWAILSQVGIAASFGGMALCNPEQHMWTLFVLAMFGAFFSASQDVTLDAQRRELFSKEDLWMASTFFTNGYRVGMIASGALCLMLAKYLPWWQVYGLMAVVTMSCSLWVILSEEPKIEASSDPTDFNKVILEPFREFFSRHGWVSLLAFVALYKIGDSMAAALRTTFLLETGYSYIQIAEISKGVGLMASICGAFAGGIAMVRLGLVRSLWIFGALQAISTLGFWQVARVSPDLALLAGVIGFENFTGGLGTSAYVAFLSSICDRRFGGTQYAGLTSLMRIPALIVSTQTGRIVNLVGWPTFFLICVGAALPAFTLLPRVTALLKARQEVHT